MKLVILLLGALACAQPIAAQAQAANDDVRCLLVSAGYARAAKTDQSRRASAMTGAFFLGRLTGRMSPAALAAAIRAQGKGLPAGQAEPVMRACAARAAAAEQQMSAAARQAEAGK